MMGLVEVLVGTGMKRNNSFGRLRRRRGDGGSAGSLPDRQTGGSSPPSSVVLPLRGLTEASQKLRTLGPAQSSKGVIDGPAATTICQDSSQRN